MAVDVSLIKPENLIATGPTPTNTAVPTKVTKPAGQENWVYEFPNKWPEIGTWTVTLNADGFTVPKGTVMGTFPISQGTFYALAINWTSMDAVTIVGNRVTALETAHNALGARVGSLELANTAMTGRAAALETADTVQAARITALETTNTAQATAIAALATRIDELEVQVVLPTP